MFSCVYLYCFYLFDYFPVRKLLGKPYVRGVGVLTSERRCCACAVVLEWILRFSGVKPKRKKKSIYYSHLSLLLLRVCKSSTKRMFFFFPRYSDLWFVPMSINVIGLNLCFQGTALFWPQKAVYLFIFILIRFINVTIIFFIIKIRMLHILYSTLHISLM